MGEDFNRQSFPVAGLENSPSSEYSMMRRRCTISQPGRWRKSLGRRKTSHKSTFSHLPTCWEKIAESLSPHTFCRVAVEARMNQTSFYRDWLPCKRSTKINVIFRDIKFLPVKQNMEICPTPRQSSSNNVFKAAHLIARFNCPIQKWKVRFPRVPRKEQRIPPPCRTRALDIF